ncbi:MAG: SDR family NAD(P)-dependent oxidoreductase [Burkholderiaceae bacterium]
MATKNQKIVISGAATGIGAAMARRFGEQGASLVLMDINQQGLDEVIAGLTGNGVKAQGIVCDVSNAEAVSDACEQALEFLGGIDVLVNNAATYTPMATITELSVDDWHNAIAVNLTSAFLLSRAVIPAMQKAGQGIIINTASQLGSVGSTGRAPYCAAKGGIIQLTKALALDHAKDGIRVNSLSPGAVLTNRLNFMYGTPEKATEALAPKHPIGRLGDADEIARAALFLASDDAAYMTGSDLLIDGGYNAQ